MRFMAGLTAFLRRQMLEFPGEWAGIVAVQADLVPLAIKQKPFRSVVRQVAEVALPLFGRLVHHLGLPQLFGQPLVAKEADVRHRRLQIGAADQAVLAVATGTVTLGDRLMYHPGGKFLAVLVVAIKTGFAASGSWRARRTGTQQTGQQEQGSQSQKARNRTFPFRTHDALLPREVLCSVFSRQSDSA